jgi:hypothetical protein
MKQQPRIVAVKALPEYIIELTFTTGEVGQVSLREWVVGRGGIFAPLEAPEYFALVAVNPEIGTIQWPNDVDFCPDVLYSKATGKPLPFAEMAAAVA